jgi:predicted DNA-binding transcriptional regulator YafY
MQHLLENVQPGLLEPHTRPLLERLNAIVGKGDHSSDEVRRRVRVLHLGARAPKLEHFEVVAQGVLKRRRLRIRHWNRQRNDETERDVSPQRLVHYRDNWYLDAWCHHAGDVRSFAMDAIRAAVLLDERAREIAKQDLDDILKSGYGIFAGKTVIWAKLRFTPERARWVANEAWHEQQRSCFEADGSYVLEVPYADDRELVMDILKFGPDVEVLAPAKLRKRVVEQLNAAARRYS